MKILVVTPRFPPMPGGVSDYARQWAIALAGTAMHPEIVVMTPADARPEKAFRVIRIPDRWGIGAWRGLVGRIEREKPDVVFVHYEPHMYQRRGLALVFTPLLLWLAARRIPVVTMAHELYYGRGERLRMQPVAWVQRLALWPLFAGSRRIVLTVPDRFSRMQHVFPKWQDRFRLLPVGRNIAPAPAEDFRQAHDVPPDAVLLLFIGLVHPSKGFPLLLRTITALEERGLESRVIIMGGGSIDHPWALNLGYASHSEASRALAAADLALLPLTDGASTRRTSLLNALGAGLPVVSTLGSNTDYDLLKGAVRLVPASDEGAFVEATAELVSDPAGRASLGERGLQLFERSLSWEVQGELWYSLLAEAT